MDAHALAVVDDNREHIRTTPSTRPAQQRLHQAQRKSGQADKAQVTMMVTRLLKLDSSPRPADAADALALAICHVWRGGTQARIEAARLAAAQRAVR